MLIFNYTAGSFIDQVTKTVMTPTNVTHRQTEKGVASIVGANKYITQSISMLPEGDFTVVVWSKLKPSFVVGTDRASFISNTTTGLKTIMSSYNVIGGKPILSLSSSVYRVFNYIPDKNWHCYIFTFSNISTSTLKVDNVNISAFDTSIGTEDARSSFVYVGGGNNSSANIEIAKIKVYDTVLTTDEQTKEYKEFLQATPTEKEIRGFEYPKPTDLSHERNTQFTGDEYIQVMEFTDNSGTTSNLRLNSGGDFAVIDWTGDSDFQEISTSTETNSNVIPSTVKIFAKNGELTYFRSNNNKYNFDIANLPSGLTYYNNAGSNTTTGDIGNLPSGLTYYYNYGSNTTTGDIANLPSGVTRYINAGNNQVDTYTAGRTWDSGVNYIEHKPAAGYGLFSTEVDNLLIDLDNSGMSSGTIDISGNNAARTSASDSAVTSLKGKGVSVTTN